MNSLGALSSHPIFHRLAVALFEFVWQGVLVAALWAAARAMLARSFADASQSSPHSKQKPLIGFPCSSHMRSSTSA
jgi:hypothetical protein